MMPQAQDKIIPTRWPNGEVMGIPASSRLAAMSALLTQTQLRIRWSHQLGMIEFIKEKP